MFTRNFRYGFCVFLFGLLGLTPETAMAHLVNTNVGEFYAGMMHPMTSAEHLLPILALALLASQLGKRVARGVVLLFPLTLAMGVLVGYYYPELGFVHIVNLWLLVVLGGVLIVSASAPPLIAPVFSVCTGLILGYRSGVDMAAAAVGMQFIPGVALTGLIIVALFAAWVPEASSNSARTVRTFLGAGFSLAGMVIILFPILGLELQSIRSVGIPGQEELVSMVKSKDLSVPVALAALTGSFIWGAGHALTPGHGKALVGAYLVGSQGNPWHAIYLGLTVTVTHTLGVFMLGLVATLAAGRVDSEKLFPWLGVVSGLIVVALGGMMFIDRIRSLLSGRTGSAHHHGHHHTYDPSHAHVHNHEYHVEEQHDHHAELIPHHKEHGHSHHTAHVHQHHDDHNMDHSHDLLHHHHSRDGHTHLPPGANGAPITWRSLLTLGISGGLLPCPSALVLLLAAVALNRTGLGLALVTAFSFGLAGVLSLVGLLFIRGSHLINKVPSFAVAGRLLPTLSALVIFLLGGGITWKAVSKIIIG